MLNYRTRGNSSINGKSKVCVLFIHEDKQYFDLIVKDIFETQNCSIWFVENNESLEDYEIEEMQLSIFIVSETLFSSQHKLKIKDIINKFVEKKIPVLPIVVNFNLEIKFESLFGNIEYLDRVSLDSSAIPYSQKLKHYLNQVLVSNSLYTSIKSSFDANIFLSYRKKDRIHAKKIMKIIHNNSKFNSVAVWYDEFLIPGENYDNAIEDTIRTSDIFTLAITPNILKDKNYIERIEYPIAKNNMIPIVPIECINTDIEKVKNHYPDIPNFISVNNEAKIHDTLLYYLNNLNNNIDKKKNYLLGEAYLSGICVEVDRNKGYSLIHSAAKADYIPAMNKLVFMFEHGYTVEKNIIKAIEWQAKIVKNVEDIAEKTRDEKDAIIFLKDVDKLIELLHKSGKYNEMIIWCEKSYTVSKSLCFGSIEENRFKKINKTINKYVKESKYFQESLYYFVRSNRIILEWMLEMGAPPDNLKKLEFKSINITKAISWIQYDNSKLDIEFCKMCCIFMEECVNTGNYQGLESWEDYFYDYFNQIPQDRKSNKLWYWVSNVNMVDGESYLMRKDYNKAHELFQAVENNINKLVAEYPKDRKLNLLKARNSLNIATLYFAESKNSLSLEYVELAKNIIDIFEIKKDGVFEILLYYDIASMYTKILNEFKLNADEFDLVISMLTEALDTTSNYFKANLHSKLHFKRAELLILLGETLANNNNYNAARKYYLDANTIIQDITAISKSPKYIQFLAEISERLLKLSISSKNYFEINKWYETAFFHRYSLSCGRDFRLYGRHKTIDSPEEDTDLFNKILKKENDINAITLSLKDTWNNETMKFVFEKKRYNPGIKLNEATVNKYVKDIISNYIEHHPMINIIKELYYVQYCTDMNAERNDVTMCRVAKKIINFFNQPYYKHYINPYKKYDEEAMIIYAYVLCNYCCSSYFIPKEKTSKLLYKLCSYCWPNYFISSNEKILKLLVERFFNISFWNQKFSEIEHKDIWYLLYKWQKFIVSMSNKILK